MSFKSFFRQRTKKRLDRAVQTLVAPDHKDPENRRAAQEAVDTIRSIYEGIDGSLSTIRTTLANANLESVGTQKVSLDTAIIRINGQTQSYWMAVQLREQVRASDSPIDRVREMKLAQRLDDRVRKLSDRINQYYESTLN